MILNTKNINIAKSKIQREFTNQQDYTSCALCGKELKTKGFSFHKSHTVPFFCLENIKGEYQKNCGVLTSRYVCLSTPFSEKEFVGTGSAGVFYSICPTCDQEKFKIYESEEALLNKPPRELVDSMALKIYLSEQFYTRFRHFKTKLDFTKLTEDELISTFYKNISNIERDAVDADVIDFQKDLDFARKSFEKGHGNYRIIYHSILDYTVPIAAQVSIPISRNVDYSKLQTVNINNKNRIEDILVCIFPLKEKSVIIVFTRIDNFLIKKYIKQFKHLSEDNKLKEIFYLLIRYKSFNYFFSPLLTDILKDNNIRGVAGIEDTQFTNGFMKFDLADFEEHNWKDNLPSLLSKEYSLQSLSSKKEDNII